MLQTKGKTIDEALTAMKAEQQSALDKLQKIGFAPERITFEDFGVDQAQDNNRRQMEMMVAQRIRQSNPRPAAAAAESVTLKCMVFAESPLTGKTVEDILKESYTLKQKVKAANIITKKTMTPEEEELEEEMAGMVFTGEQNFDSEPRLLYAVKLLKEESQKAYAEAFVQAQQQGDFLVAAVGAARGRLLQLSGSVNSSQRNNLRRYSSQQDYYLMNLVNDPQSMFDPVMGQMTGTNSMTGLSISPDPIEFVFRVQAAFGIR
jgi:hypothetical protein